MATSLFKMPFDIDKTRVHQIYRSETLDRAGVETISCDEMKEIYGELKFDKLYEDRPYTYTSLVTSIDGRIAFTDAPQGPLIAKLNQYDGDGAGADWWILNMLRAVSDGDIIGAGTMNAESDYTAHVFPGSWRTQGWLRVCSRFRGMSFHPWMPPISPLTICCLRQRKCR